MKTASQRHGDQRRYQRATLIAVVVWTCVVALALVAASLLPQSIQLPLPSGLTLLQLVALLAGIMVASEVFMLITHWGLARKGKPPIEGVMVGRLYRLVAVLAIILGVAYGFGKLDAFGSFFALFGGMLLGWSLQAPVSGVAAWMLISLMRPFRPGDRIQFPNLGLVGDVVEQSPMYTILDQVGGSVGSEEAVGRHILVPNAMLFGQVVINYTVVQEAAYMLDEVIVRITFDSDWNVAEKVLLGAAEEVTGDIIQATGQKPYIRADSYDYGVYLRLRYQTRPRDRAEIAYKLNKVIYKAFQDTAGIDLAIPFIYSYRAGEVFKEEPPRDKEARNIQQIPIEAIQQPPVAPGSKADIEQLAQSIAAHGLLQPIMVIKNPETGLYDILAGHLRFQACSILGWRTVPAVVRTPGEAPGSRVVKVQAQRVPEMQARGGTEPGPGGATGGGSAEW